MLSVICNLYMQSFNRLFTGISNCVFIEMFFLNGILFVYLYGEMQSPRSIVPVKACETGALTEGFVFHPCSYTNSQYPVYYLAEI